MELGFRPRRVGSRLHTLNYHSFFLSVLSLSLAQALWALGSEISTNSPALIEVAFQ